MSASVTQWVRRHPARTPSQQAVLRALAWAADDDGRGARRSVRQLAAETTLHRNTAFRALRDLTAEDRIRRHVGGAEHCEHCRKASRGVAVYDVVMPAEQAVPDGQMNLLAGAAERHHAGTDVVTVAAGDSHHHGDRSVTATVTLKDQKTDHHHHQEGAREQQGGQLADVVQAVTDLLGRVEKPGWYVDPIAVEALVMTWSPHRDPMRAAAQVVATAMDHQHLNAAKLLGNTLRWMRTDAPAERRGLRAVPAETTPDAFAKYDQAAGLA